MLFNESQGSTRQVEMKKMLHRIVWKSVLDKRNEQLLGDEVIVMARCL
jgi:hypothetical protein